MLTTSQKQALKSEIIASSEDAMVALEADPGSADKAFAVSLLYNQLASPAFIVWKTDVTTIDIRAVLVWAEYDALSVSKQNAFAFLCSNHIVNAALTNVRQGIQSIFTGPNQSGNLAAMIAIAKRAATRAEKLFAAGTGSDASPATMTFEGNLSYQDVLAAMGS
jgi:hypothetical protein